MVAKAQGVRLLKFIQGHANCKGEVYVIKICKQCLSVQEFSQILIKWSPIVTDNDKITRSVLTVKTHAKVDVIFSINKVFKND